MGVATGTNVITTNVEIPSNLETGASTLEVIANGIPSKPVSIEVSKDRSGDKGKGG